jgi:uncharacterized membrane protein YoaK (UPF0700 family)
MSSVPISRAPAGIDDDALRRAAASVRHPLTRALLALTFTTGLIDAVSYLGLGHVFTANMTGNVVLLGFGIAGSGGLPVLAPIVSLVAFLVGAGAGGALVRRNAQLHHALVARGLGIETSLLAVAAVAAAAGQITPGDTLAYLLIALMASAMGVRNAIVRHIGVADLTTTVLTMTLTGFAAESSVAGGTGKGSVRRLAAVAVMFLGALAGALLLKSAAWVPLALASAIALATWVLYVPAARHPAGSRPSAPA